MSPAIRQTEEKYGIKSDVLTPRLQKQLDDLLAPDEEILWQGQPAPPKGVFSGCLIPLLAVAQIPTVDLITTVVNGNNHGNNYSWILGVVCATVGLAIILAFTHSVYVRRDSDNTVYAVTTKRVIIVEAGKQYPERVGNITADQTGGRTFSLVPYGFETLNFPNARMQYYFPGGILGSYTRGGYFVRLQNIHKVDRLIRDTFGKQQTQVSMAPISSRTSLM